MTRFAAAWPVRLGAGLILALLLGDLVSPPVARACSRHYYVRRGDEPFTPAAPAAVPAPVPSPDEEPAGDVRAEPPTDARVPPPLLAPERPPPSSPPAPCDGPTCSRSDQPPLAAASVKITLPEADARLTAAAAGPDAGRSGSHCR